MLFYDMYNIPVTLKIRCLLSKALMLYYIIYKKKEAANLLHIKDHNENLSMCTLHMTKQCEMVDSILVNIKLKQ